MRLPPWTVVLVITALRVSFSEPALGTEEIFAALGVQRPANPSPAPDLELASLEGRTVHIKDFRGKVVLLGFFTTT